MELYSRFPHAFEKTTNTVSKRYTLDGVALRASDMIKNHFVKAKQRAYIPLSRTSTGTPVHRSSLAASHVDMKVSCTLPLRLTILKKSTSVLL